MTHPDDVRVLAAFSALEPDDVASARMEKVVLSALDSSARYEREFGARDLAREWVSLLSARPAANGLLVAAAGVLLLLSSPLALLPLSWLG